MREGKKEGWKNWESNKDSKLYPIAKGVEKEENIKNHQAIFK
jgi:hypothetical protein